jgi:hypothetical protein
VWILRGARALAYPEPTSIFQPMDEKPVVTLEGAIAVGGARAVGCALLENGTVWCNGLGHDDLLAPAGAGDTVEAPVQIPGLDAVESLSVGPYHACALRSNDEVWCWGRREAFAKAGGSGPAPTKVAARARAVAAGNFATCIVQMDGRVACFGMAFGAGSAATAVIVEGLQDARTIAVGDKIGCAVDGAERVSCWAIDKWAELASPLRLVAKVVALEAAVPSTTTIGVAHPVMPLMRDGLGHPVMPVPEDAKCWASQKLWDPRAKACRWYPGGCYHCSAGCSMGGGGGSLVLQPCMTGSTWNGCDCGCPGGGFDGNKRTCVAVPSP